MLNQAERTTGAVGTASFERMEALLARPWFPWLASTLVMLVYGAYLFATGNYLIVNDFFGHVWMALEERETGLGSSTNVVIPSGYPILLNLLHSSGMDYMTAGRLLSLLAAVPFLSLVWIAASRVGVSIWAGPFAWLLTATSYHFMLTAATPLPDLVALSMTMPLIVLALSPTRSLRSLVLASGLAGLACCVRYNFLQSILPLSVLLVLFSNDVSWRSRGREVSAVMAGLAIGLLPEIVFASRIGHIPFQTASKYYLTLLVGETDFLMTGTQLRQMPSALEYIVRHGDKIFRAVGEAYLQKALIFIVLPAAVWWIAERTGLWLQQTRLDRRTRRLLAALLIFEAMMLIPISLRQPLPYYVIPLLSWVSFVIAAVPVVRLAGSRNLFMSAAIAMAVIASAAQARSAMAVLSKSLQVSFNKIVADELLKLGVHDSAEVLNLVAPFELHWPYGDRAPLFYYTMKEPGWVSLTNSIERKRPFIYDLTAERVKGFRVVLTHPLSTELKDKFLPGFDFVKQVGRVQIYRAGR